MEVKHSHMGVAAASYWLMGGSPRMSSMVRSMEAVEYMVLTFALRLA